MLKDVIGLGSYCIQVLQRREALCFATMIIRCRSVEPFLIWSGTWGHLKYLLSAVAHLMKIIIQLAAAEKTQGGADASATDRVSGVGILNKIH